MTDTNDLQAIEFYWRPGCPFCSGLERSLTRLALPLDKRNIWEEPDHAAFVRSVADGNETVPTLRIGEISMVNPSPDEVLAALGDQAPHLVPEGVEVPEQGRVGRVVRRVLGG